MTPAKITMVLDKGSKVQLSPHFNSSEFDCPCTYEDCTFTLILKSHLDWLEKQRDRVGKPFVITSGFRCPRHNKDVGGAVKSQHLRGTATDIQIRGLTALEASVKLDSADGLGVYQNFVHVDSRGHRARWVGSY